MLTTFKIWSKSSKLVTNHERVSMTLKSKLKHPSGSLKKSQDRKKNVKFNQMWRFCLLFSSIAIAWCIMNTLIRNATLKICGHSEDQLVRNLQNCGKTNHGFFAMIIYQRIILEISLSALKYLFTIAFILFKFYIVYKLKSISIMNISLLFCVLQHFINIMNMWLFSWFIYFFFLITKQNLCFCFTILICINNPIWFLFLTNNNELFN